MKKEKIKFLYYQSITTERSLIKGIKEFKDKKYKLELLSDYLARYDIRKLYSSNIENIDELLLELSTKNHYSITYDIKDYLYLKQQGKTDLLISMYYTRRADDAKELVLETGVYNENILIDLKNKYGIKILALLYEKTKDDLILSVANFAADAMGIYKAFLIFMSKENTWYKGIIKRIKEECSISEILEEHNIFSEEELIDMWKYHYDSLTSEDVYNIFNTYSYKEEAIEKLLDVLCKDKNPYYLFLVLTNKPDYEYVRGFNQKEIARLEKALRNSKNIEYNLYYEYYKNKDELTEKFGGKVNLLVYLNNNKSEFTNDYEYSILKNMIENEIRVDANGALDDEEINSFLFRDSEGVKENSKNSKKIVNKAKKG